FLLLVGCGGSKKTSGVLSGTITYKSQPVNGATLILHPAVSGQGAEFNVPVTQEGTFRTSGVPVGEYKVVVQASPGNAGPSTKGMPPDKLAEAKDKLSQLSTPATIKFPEKYKQLEKTELKVTVGPGEQTVTLELKD